MLHDAPVCVFPQYGDTVRDVWAGIAHSAQHHQQDDHQWGTYGKGQRALIIWLLYLIILDSSLYLCSVPLPGVSGPADSDSGDAQDRAYMPAEHGAAAGREAGQPGGE